MSEPRYSIWEDGVPIASGETLHEAVKRVWPALGPLLAALHSAAQKTAADDTPEFFEGTLLDGLRELDPDEPHLDDAADEVDRQRFAARLAASPPGPPGLHGDVYTTGTGQRLNGIHDRAACENRPCVIHAPSAHVMSDFPTHWREDRGIMERICPHGVGHPDPDGNAFMRSRGEDVSVHGCDGCCAPPPLAHPLGPFADPCCGDPADCGECGA